MNFKAGYWVALGIFAVALNSQYKQGSFPAAHRAVDRAESVLCHLVRHAEQSLAFARILVKHDQPELLASNQVYVQQEMEAAREQAQMAREMARDQVREQREAIREQARAEAEAARDQIHAQMDVIRAQAGIRRQEIERVREQVRSQMHVIRSTNRHIRVVCPEKGSTMVMNSDSDPADSDTGPF